MHAALVFPVKKSILTVTNLFVEGLDVFAIGNDWNEASSVSQSRGPRNQSGKTQVQHSASLRKQATVKARIPASLEGLLVENGRWLAGAFGAVLTSEDQGRTWHPFATMPETCPVHTLARHEGRLWAASPHGFLARQKEPSTTGASEDHAVPWEQVASPLACHKSPVWYSASQPYPDVGISRLKVIGDELHLVGNGLFTLSTDPTRATTQHIASSTLLVDVAQTSKGTLLAVGIHGAYERREEGTGSNAWVSAPRDAEHPGYVAIVPMADGVLRVSKRGVDAIEWSTDDGRTFTPIPCPALAEPDAYLHLAVPDGHGGVLVSGFNGLLIRVSPGGGLGPWETPKPPRKTAASNASAKDPPAIAPARDARVEAKLRADLYASRDDDAARLVYADWLTEHGDPRGEFIQLQCELRRPIWGADGHVDTNDRTPLPPNHVELTQREQVLFKKHAKAWIAPIRAFLRQSSWRRGFLSVVTTGPNFLPGASEVLHAHPIEVLSLEGMKPTDLATLARTPLPTLRSLRLDAQRIDAKGARLFASRNLSALTNLSVQGNDLGNEGLRILSHGSELCALEGLNVRGCGIEDAGLRSLADAPVLDALVTLDIGTNPLTIVGYETLANAARLPKLRTVNLGRHVEPTLLREAVAILAKRFEILTT